MKRRSKKRLANQDNPEEQIKDLLIGLAVPLLKEGAAALKEKSASVRKGIQAGGGGSDEEKYTSDPIKERPNEGDKQEVAPKLAAADLAAAERAAVDLAAAEKAAAGKPSAELATAELATAEGAAGASSDEEQTALVQIAEAAAGRERSQKRAGLQGKWELSPVEVAAQRELNEVEAQVQETQVQIEAVVVADSSCSRDGDAGGNNDEDTRLSGGTSGDDAENLAEGRSSDEASELRDGPLSAGTVGAADLILKPEEAASIEKRDDGDAESEKCETDEEKTVLFLV
jgi:hypothetical protein